MAHEEIVVRPGTPFPLGATWLDDGTNFAVFSEHAEAIDVCLYDDEGDEPTRVIRLQDRDYRIWHGFLVGVKPGTRYSLRAHGPYEPENGHRFNAAKALIDPYAKALDGTVTWGPQLYAYNIDDSAENGSLSDIPNDASIPKSVVVDHQFDWEDDAPPNTPWLESVIYEVHVKGFTAQHPEIPEEIRGTYAGLAHPVAVDYLKQLGVTAVELLPVHAFVDDHFLVEQGLRNYWGYSTLGFFAPEGRYAAASHHGDQVREFKEMVKTLHAAGIEVIMDVVYNHTCEGNHLGPTLSWRGLDNANYYRLMPEDKSHYLDFTGTGNTVNTEHPQVLSMVMDSLRYWVEEMHIDGFRFDLASTLGREAHDVDPYGGFFDAIHQDPVLSRVKLIAEPWDTGEGGYQVGNFPVLWSEWNDRFRDEVRTFWQTDDHDKAAMGYRLTGSSDLYKDTGRGPRASVNFIVAHDGFTLEDLVSYSKKHNKANGENNRDGHDHNISANYGVEGPTDDEAILALRDRQKRNLLATMLLSQGIPMLCGGDEIGRTQRGNNNAYCQDNEISWFDWNLDERDTSLRDFVSHLISIRKQHPILRRRRFFKGLPQAPGGFKDAAWWHPEGRELEDEEWQDHELATLGLRMAGDAIEERDEDGNPITTSSLLLILHAGKDPVSFTFPLVERGRQRDDWKVLVSTDTADGKCCERYKERSTITIPGRTVLLLEGLAHRGGAQ